MSLIETIIAPATPPGEGSVAIVRLSGPRAIAMLAEVFVGRTPVTEMETHRLCLGRLLNHQGQTIDRVLAVVMRAPRSYTGEDVVEVHCHGGSQILRSVLDLFLAGGARMAQPGEFTRRAFLNGRLDLTQAEAVVAIMQARSEHAGRVALGQLEGHLSQQLHVYADRIKQSLSLLEAYIDFSEEEVGVLDLPALLDPLMALRADMQSLADSFDSGRALREGLNLLILGRPNVGKSSLMNAMLGEARAIVTEIAGTTRDILEEQLVLAGYPLRLIDAAGVRDTDDPIEREGVRRAREKAAAADVVLLVVDGSQPLTDEDHLAISLCRPGNSLAVINKSDLTQVFPREMLLPFFSQVEISARSGYGLAQLRETIVSLLSHERQGLGEECLVVTERRHRDALLQAIEALGRLDEAAALADPFECLAIELREALYALGQITGETTPDEILDQIFDRFCIGK